MKLFKRTSRNPERIEMERCAARGVALLGGRLPGWRNTVQRRRLDMYEPSDCIIGQIFGDYYKGIQLLGITETEAYQYGFDMPRHDQMPMLTEVWKELL